MALGSGFVGGKIPKEQLIAMEIANLKAFQATMNKISKLTNDFRIPFTGPTGIAADFFKSQKAIWNLKSAGQYQDLSQATLDQRHRDGQPIWPILLGPDSPGHRGGALMRSMTDPKGEGTINQIINKRELILGTKVKSAKGFNYPASHQFGAPGANIPRRPFLFIGPEAPRFARGPTAGRPKRWLGIMDDYMASLLKRATRG